MYKANGVKGGDRWGPVRTGVDVDMSVRGPSVHSTERLIGASQAHLSLFSMPLCDQVPDSAAVSDNRSGLSAVHLPMGQLGGCVR